MVLLSYSIYMYVILLAFFFLVVFAISHCSRNVIQKQEYIVFNAFKYNFAIAIKMFYLK